MLAVAAAKWQAGRINLIYRLEWRQFPEAVCADSGFTSELLLLRWIILELIIHFEEETGTNTFFGFYNTLVEFLKRILK